MPVEEPDLSRECLRRAPQFSNISCELSLRKGCGTECSEKPPADTEGNFTQNQSLSRRRERTVLPNLCITDTLTDERNVTTLADLRGM